MKYVCIITVISVLCMITQSGLAVQCMAAGRKGREGGREGKEGGRERGSRRERERLRLLSSI